jgi:hypothetical protein
MGLVDRLRVSPNVRKSFFQVLAIGGFKRENEKKNQNSKNIKPISTTRGEK